MLQRVDLADRILLEPGATLEIDGFPEDTLVRDSLLALAKAAAVEPNWAVRIEKRIPVAAGLGGGSSDAAAALRLANDSLPSPVSAERLHEVAAEQGADVPFFLTAARSSAPVTARSWNPSSCLPTTRSFYCFPGPRRSRRQRTSTPRSRANTTSTSGTLGCARPSKPATSPHCRRTTSPPRRSHRSFAPPALSARTSREPARRSTGSSPLKSRPPPLESSSPTAARPG